MRRYLTTPDGQVKPTAFSEIALADLPSDVVRGNATNTITGDLVLTGAHVVTIGHPISGTLTGINAYVTGKGFTINASGIDLVPGGTFNNGHLLWKTGGVLAGFAPGSANQLLASNGTVPGWITNLPIANFNGGTSAGSTTYWRGDGTWVNPLASAVLTGIPTAPTAAYGTNTTQIATTAFAIKEVYGEPLGQLFAEDFASTANFSSTGGASLSIVGGKLRVAGGSNTQTDLSRYSIYTPYVTALDKWIFEATYTLDNVLSTTTFGPGFGIQSAADNSGARFSLQWFLDCSTAATGGRVFIYYNGVTLLASSTLAITIAQNDIITMRAERKGSQFTVTYTNETTDRSTSATYEYVLGIGTSAIMPNKGNFAVYSKGSGTYDVSVFKVSSEAYKNPDFLTVGDSMFAGYYNGDISNRAVTLLSEWSGKKFVNIAQASHISSDFVDLIPEILLIDPDTVILLSINDAEHATLGAFQTNIDALTDALDAAGIAYIICTLPPRNDAVDPRSFNTWLASTYPGKLVDLFAAMSDGSAFGGVQSLFSDFSHFNYSGQLKMANLIANKIGLNRTIIKYRPFTFDRVLEPTQAYQAVNWMTMTSAATTVAPSFSMTGSDTNIGLNITAKGINRSSSAFRWNGGGFGINIPIGTTITGLLQTRNETATTGNVFSQHTTDAIPYISVYQKTRGTGASPTTVATGDLVASFNARSFGTSLNNIQAGFGWVAGTVSGANVPTEFVIASHATGGDMAGINSADTRFRITAAGLVAFGMGTTAPTARLQVRGTGTTTAQAFLVEASDGTDRLEILDNGTTTLTGNFTASNVLSGTYTPTITNVANVSASANGACQYMRVGNVVTVSGSINVDPTTTLTDTQVGISLPIASAIANAREVAGTAFCPAIAGQGAAIVGDATNDRATMQWMASDVTAQLMFFTFTYSVL